MTDWDTFIAANNGSLLQTTAFGQLKADFGWPVQRITLTEGDAISGGLQFFSRPAKVATIAYVPRGPIITDDAQFEQLLAAIPERDPKAAFLQIEPDLPDTPANRDRLTALGLTPVDDHIQPPRTIVIDLTPALDDILMRMSQSTRRKVRLSDRKGIDIRQTGVEDIDSYTRLTEITGDRNDFYTYPPDYYRKALEVFGDQAALFMASYEGLDVAGLMAFRIGQRAYYLYGASSNKHRNRMPTYGLQWAAIQWAKTHGCTTYDMWGIPDEDEATLEDQFRDRHDGLWGVYGFKRGFGGEVTRSIGMWQQIYKPIVYKGLQFAQSVRPG